MKTTKAVLSGSSDGISATEKIFKLTWQGGNLQWVTLQQELKFPRPNINSDLPTCAVLHHSKDHNSIDFVIMLHVVHEGELTTSLLF